MFWTWRSRRRLGRPGVPADVRQLIRGMAEANPLWGAPRIHGELLKLGIGVSQAMVAKYMPRHRCPPSQTWRTFLANHVNQIAAADFFVVPTVTYRLSSCRWSSMTTALHAEAERPPRVSTQNFVPTPSPIRPPVRRIWASLPLASSPQVRTPLTALRFRSVRYCLIRLLPDAPSRVVRSCERPCLVEDGFPPSGPQEDLTTTCLTSFFCVHAEHTKAARPSGGASRP